MGCVQFDWDVMALSFHVMCYYHVPCLFRVFIWGLVFPKISFCNQHHVLNQNRFCSKPFFDQGLLFESQSFVYSKDSFSIKRNFIKVFLFNQRRLLFRPKNFWIKDLFLTKVFVGSSFYFFFNQSPLLIMKALLIKGVLLNQRFLGLLSKVVF